MLKIKFIIFICFIFISQSCKQSNQNAQDIKTGILEHSTHNIEHENHKQDGYYTCAMHSQVISKEPGNCPICNMKLTHITPDNMEEVTKGASDKNFYFSVATNLLQNSNIATTKVVKDNFKRITKYSAHVDYDESSDKIAAISIKYDGWVEKLYINREGQQVKKGQALMGIYSPILLAAKEEYKTALNIIRGMPNYAGDIDSDPTIKATKQKLRYLDVSESEIRTIETTGIVSRLTTIHSPIQGIIAKKNIIQGVYITAGFEVFRIANLSSVWVLIHVFANDLEYIKSGDIATITPNGLSIPLKGKVDLIYPFVDEMGKDIKVRIIINNINSLLKPGMFVDVLLHQQFKGQQIIIPDTSILYSGEKSYVFISRTDTQFELRTVKVLTTSNGQAVISEGLHENEKVVINGQFLLDSEASLKEEISKSGGQTNSMAGHNH